MNRLLLSILIFGLCACASLSKEGRMVREISGTLPNTCMFKGAVVGNSASAVGGDRYAAARTDLFNETGSAGGNFVRVSNVSTGPFSTNIYGEAYSCPTDMTLVVHEATPEEKVANELKRGNDITEQEQQARVLERFSRQITPQNVNCTSRPIYDADGKLIRTDTVCN